MAAQPAFKWSARPRDYKKEWQQQACQFEPATAEEDPLKPQVIVMLDSQGQDITSSSASASAARDVDPLADDVDPLADNGMDDDPLRAAVVKATRNTKKVALDDSFEPWEARKPGILAKYTTTQKLSLVSSFLTGRAPQLKLQDRVKSRLEQVDEFGEGKLEEIDELSAKEFVDNIEHLRKTLVKAWQQDQKVKALKVVIQCAKMLADTRVITFYPSKFILITDILDTFGSLVFERLRGKAAEGYKQRLPEDFTTAMVSGAAQNVATNWFFKIASIRELLPRVLVEAALLKCYRFKDEREIEGALDRMARQLRGVGNPLVAAFARCYICKVGMEVAPLVRSYQMPLFDDVVSTLSAPSAATLEELKKQNVDLPAYHALFVPALDWILQCVAYKVPGSVLADILDKSEHQKGNTILLNSIMSSFPPPHISSRATKFTNLIKSNSGDGLPIAQLFASLGTNLVLAAPAESDRRAILEEVWSVVRRITRVKEYLSCAEVWIEYPVKYFGPREVDALLGDIIQHVSTNREFENHYPQLQSTLHKILSSMSDFTVLFTHTHFSSFLDLFLNSPVQGEVFRTVLEAFVRTQREATADPVIINSMLYFAKALHDSITMSSFEDERRQITRLILRFLSKIQFGQRFAPALEFFIEARGAFANFDSVLQQLVHSVNALLMQRYTALSGKHTRESSAFVRQCVSFTFTTIPSIEDPTMRVRLYVSSGIVAVMNSALSQADIMFRQAVQGITSFPDFIEINGCRESSENTVFSLALETMSALLLVPDSPDDAMPLAIFKQLLNDVSTERTWSNTNLQARLLVAGVKMFAAFSQKQFLYTVPNVEANDSLYEQNVRFLGDLSQSVSRILLLAFETSGSSGDDDFQFDVFSTLVMCGDLAVDDLRKLASDHYSLLKGVQVKLRARTMLEGLAESGIPGSQELLALCS
eukprot:m.73039 g.73039  ORF g.73039 m.73039 type:complete len:934 (+) comp12354_c1_seq1:63-2864(+)